MRTGPCSCSGVATPDKIMAMAGFQRSASLLRDLHLSERAGRIQFRGRPSDEQ